MFLIITSATFADNMEGILPKSITIFSEVSGGSWWGIGVVLSKIFMKSGVPSNTEIRRGVSNIV
jgi:hypothetical protein